MTHLISLALRRPLLIAEIINAVTSQLPLSVQRHARPEILVS